MFYVHFVGAINFPLGILATLLDARSKTPEKLHIELAMRLKKDVFSASRDHQNRHFVKKMQVVPVLRLVC